MKRKLLQNYHSFATAILVMLFHLLTIGTAYSQTWKLIQPAYPTIGTFVAGFSVADYGATGDGVTDVTAIFQARLNALKALGGGTLFVPSGKYVLKGTLIIPKGITLRGEWQLPVKGQPIVGTILMVYTGQGNETAAPFITMEPSAAVMDLAIWYPQQDPNNITPYSPAIMFGETGYFGNDGCNAKNITLVNAYSGIVYSQVNSSGSHVINGIYGTPLSRGVEVDNTGDVSRLDNINFSPSYWAGSGLPGSPAAGSAYAGWILQNGTGIVMRRNDWSCTDYVNIEGYNIGFHAAPSIASVGSTPNGHNYNMTFTNCQTGIYVENSASVGIMFTQINIVNCATGVDIGPLTTGPIQFHTSTINASNLAINAGDGSMASVLLQHCTITSGKVDIAGSTFDASDCDFNNAAPQIIIEKDSRAVITGNRFKNAMQITNTSIFVSTIDQTPLSIAPLPVFPTIVPVTHMPAKQVMYLATGAPYNAVADGVTDNTTAIQSALNAAGANGGGVVFLPPGKYKVLGNLQVPTGVELKGSTDVSTIPTGPGSVLEVYAGMGSATGTPFLQLEASSGIRGLTFDYPQQVASGFPNIPAYPYCIQGNGSNIYIINIAIRAAYNGIDLFTYECDNHFVDAYDGYTFNNGIRVGAASTGGQLLNMQFNTIVYASGAQTKYGSWPNSPTGDNTPVYNYGYANLQFMILGNCKNETLYNDFIFGSNKGLILTADNATGPSGLSLGFGVDGTLNSLNFDAIATGGFDFINTQIVALGDTTTRQVTADANFKSQVTFFSSDFWGNGGRNVVANNGTLTFQTASFQSTQLQFAAINTGAKVNIENSAIAPEQLISSGSAAGISARSSIVDSTGITPKNTALWRNNIGNIWSIILHGDLDRRAWTATASIDNTGAKMALDSVVTTRWSTEGAQQPGQYIIVDMKTLNTVNKILLDASSSPGDYPVGYQVFLSTDGINWGNAVAIGTGSKTYTIITLPSLQGRYIKIVQTGTTTTTYWSIDEFRVWGEVDVTGITVNPEILSLNAKDVKQLIKTIVPANATDQTVTWVSSNTAIATVDTLGRITAVAPGKATITVITNNNAQKDSCMLTVNNVPVTGISMSTAIATIPISTTKQLTATIAPSNATNQNIVWSSSNTAVATVDANGLVTTKALGTVVITATSQDGSKTATTTVTVSNIPVTGISMNTTTATINIGSTTLLTATIAPSNATNQIVTWSSSNAAVATVDANGLVTAIAVGTAVITATSQDGGKIATTTVTVSVPVTGISLNTTTATINTNTTMQLTATIAPGNATNQQVTWSSSNAAIATVDANGLVTGQAVGTVIIKATTTDGAKIATCTVTVNQPVIAVTGLSIIPNADTLTINATKQLIANITPSNATNKTVTWSSSNTNVAQVSADGLVTAIAVGTTTISAISQDGSITGTCTITVTSASASTATVVVYPNPVKGNQINIRFPDQLTGNFTSRLTNMLGQTLQNTTIRISNGTGIVTLTQSYIPGVYELELVNETTNAQVVKKIILQ